jgi:fucose 4-O-acetylase-like acetyltransferase
MYLYTIADLWKKIFGAIFFAGREPIVGPLWFAYVLCLALITYSAISFISAKLWPKNYANVRMVACILLACISAILSNKLGLTLNRFSNTLVVVGLLCGGQYLYQVKKIRFNNAFCFAGALLIFWQSAVLNGDIELNNNKYNDLFHLFAGSAAMLYALGFISLKLEGTKIGFLVELAGRKSFEIMALHILSFKLVSLILIKMGYSVELYTNGPDTHNNILIIAAYLLTGVCLPVIATCSFDKLKGTFLNKSNYGKN